MVASFDPREMGVLHSVYRRELGLAADLIRSVRDRDTARAAVVHHHLELIESALAEHHGAEDEVIWPLLLERVPDTVAAVIRRMERQHVQLGTAMIELEVRRRDWSHGAQRSAGLELAAAYERFYRTLVEHLDEEETVVMPVAAELLSSAEWKRRAKHSTGSKKPSQIPLMFGMMQFDGDPEVIANMVPKPARLVLGPLGRRAFRRHSLAVYGAPTPPAR